MVCKSLYVRNEGNATSKRWDSQSTTTAQFTVLRISSKCSTRLEGQLKQSTADSLTGEDGAESPGKPEQIEFTGQTAEEDRAAHRENSRDPLSIQQITDQCMHVKKLPRLGRQSPEVIRGTVPDQELSLLPVNPEKFMIHRKLDFVCRRVLSQ